MEGCGGGVDVDAEVGEVSGREVAENQRELVKGVGG